MLFVGIQYSTGFLIEKSLSINTVFVIALIFCYFADPYNVYTSNMFAILGLRALYFALSAMIHRFAYLKYALSLVLIFIGGKIFYAQLWGKLDTAISLGVTFTLLAGGVILSRLRSRTSLPQSNTPASGTSAVGER